jgi:hypothetical protein
MLNAWHIDCAILARRELGLVPDYDVQIIEDEYTQYVDGFWHFASLIGDV